MNEADLNQGRGPNPPKAGFYDFVLAMLIGYCLYQALMFLWEGPDCSDETAATNQEQTCEHQ